MDNDIEVVKDSDEVSVIIKTADQTRKADITVPKDKKKELESLYHRLSRINE